MVRPGPGAPLSESDLVEMRDSLRHRGPDDAATYRADGVALGSRRLAILDVSPAGRMPMSTPDGRYTIVYNGEIYNFRELRSIPESRGYAFSSRTDTEVLLALFSLEGPACLERLNGMFAFAVWDAHEKSLFLARDRMGVKPLYYHASHDGALTFASEPKALFAAGVPSEFDTSCWEELLSFRYVAGERTLFKGITRVLPGHTLTWRNGAIERTCWWNLGDRIVSARQQRIENPRQWFTTTFDDAANIRTISDVPVGVLLSGGLDSGSVVASLGIQGHSSISNFCVRFDNPRFDEGHLARETAAAWNFPLHELRVPPKDLLPRLAKASRTEDKPLSHASDLHVLAVAEFAKPHVSVLLSGEGADETLGGYMRYLPLRWPAMLEGSGRVASMAASAGLAPHRVRKLGHLWREGGKEALLLFNASNLLPSDLRAVGLPATGRHPFREAVLAEGARLYPGEPVRQAMFSDQRTFLQSLLDRNDRLTMGASIECRIPFLDYRLVTGLGALPSRSLFAGSRRGKPLLRCTIGRRLPRAVQRAPKWGFGVPWNRYLREEPTLKDLVSSLPDVAPIAGGPFERRALQRAIQEFAGGDDDRGELVFALLTIAVWHQECCRPSTKPVRVLATVN